MTPKELHSEFVRCGKNAREWIERCKQLLLEIDRLHIWEQRGFESIYVYAAKLAGLSRSQVDSALWTLRKIENKPALKVVAVKKGLNAVRPVANLATPEDESFWAEKAEELSKHALETYVREHRIQKEQDPSQVKSCPGTREISLPEETVRRLEQLKKRADFQERMQTFLDSFEEEAPEPVESESRHVPAHIERHCVQRTNGLCAFQACNKPYHQLHHTQRFALEKIHDPARLHPLCKAHNELAHRGLIENEEGPPHTWRIRKEPDRTHFKFYIDEQFQRIQHNACHS